VPSRVCAAIILWTGLVAAQEIQVYSEFRRVDPFGEIVPQDQGGRPREILSPILARNSHATFRVVVETPPKEHYYLFVGTNPEDVFKITVYKEMWQKQGDNWTPDRLLEVQPPYAGSIPDRNHGIAGQKVEVFVVDIFVPAELKPGRYKFEPQVNCGDRWATYPMEVRVSDVVVPETPPSAGPLPSTTLSADAAVLGPLREYLCGTAGKPGSNPLDSVRALVRRNVLEDLALARQSEKESGKEPVANKLLRGLNLSPDAFCASEELTSPSGPEWYLRGRDLLYRGTLEWY
jgi:hypothetical protein